MRRLLVIVAASIVAASASTTAHARAATLPCQASAGHVGLVIEHGDGSVVQRCVGVGAPGGDAEAILAASGIQYGTVGYGGSLGDALCQVDAEPASYPPGCFQSRTANWVLFVARAGGGWMASPAGMSSLHLNSGDWFGVRYETGSTSPARLSIACPPPVVSTVPATPVHTTQGDGAAAAPPTATSAATPAGGAAPITPTSRVLALTTKAATHAPAAQPNGPSLQLILAFLLGGGLAGMFVARMARR
jgi:hypothetical protein